MLLRRLLFLDLLLAAASVHSPAQTLQSIGIVRAVSGPVFLIPATGSSARKQIRLTSSSVSRPLFDGDTIQADPQGEVTVAISGRTRTIQLKSNHPVQLHPDRPVTGAEQKLDSAIKNFGASGASREIAGLLWWPADGVSVRAHGFQVRWNPSPVPETYTLTLSNEAGEKLWSSGPIGSAAGSLKPEQNAAIERLLLQAQNETAPHSYTISVATDTEEEVRTTFSIISKAEESKVELELREWDKTQPDPLLRSLGRAATLKAANLTCELAEEYQAALSLAPESTALLRAALGADRATGNVVRARDLAAQLHKELSALSQSPEP